MKFLNILIARLRALLRRDEVLNEIDEEMKAHIELEADANRERGMTPEEARRSAMESFGNVGSIRDLAYDVKGGGFLETLLQDVRYCGRMLLKHPSFTLIIVLTLALGIGANTATFSIVNAVLLRPFPYQSPEQLVMIGEGASGGAVSYPNFADWKDDRNIFSSTSAVRGNENFNLTGAGEPERLQGRLVSAGFLSTLGVSPALGRDFLVEDDRPGVTPTTIISYGLWTRRFASDQGIIGKQITLNNQSFTVIGVAPRGFEFEQPADVSVPIGLSADRFKARGSDPGIRVVARMGSGVVLQQAQTQLNVIYQRLEQEYPKSNTGRRAYLTSLQESFVGDVRQPLLILLGSVGLVLLIACANVANLLLVRASTRRREISVRVALGASRRRIIRQLLTESIMLSLIGALLGMLVAYWGTSLVANQLPAEIPRLSQANIDSRVLIFTIGVSLVTGLLFGLAPAIQSSRLNLTDCLKEGDRGASDRRQYLRSGLVVCEVALTLTLLVGAGLLVKSFRNVLQVDPGFNARKLLTMQVSVNNPDGNQVASFFRQLQENVTRIPGVTAFAISNGLPLGVANHPTFFIQGRPLPEPGQETGAVRYTVSPGYFDAMGIQLKRGRVFTPQDTPDTPLVMIIDEALAQYFQNEDPIGKQISQSREGSPKYEIIGVVGHVEQDSLESQTVRTPQFYLAFNQIPPDRLPGYVRRINLLSRTNVDPSSLTSAVRDQIAALNKDQAIFNVRTMEEIVGQSVAPRRFSMMLLSVFALFALALASIGIYGVMSYAVTQRTREIGLRMTLGAQRGNVLRLVIGDGMKLTLAGVLLGVVAAFALTRTIKSLLFGVSATDPVTFISIALLLLLVALLACWVPARRATKVDPMIALRYE
ncbi:MAG TPA: ABC transporter permease [Pyrinomonadaceae bacterium]|jgi:putative ABC transport system permease protein|nr:ABC transporter permease [Pyrinomonadaceae bacterium]